MIPLRVENLIRRFDDQDPPAVDHVTFDVRPREVFALVGPSGCGKTTTLRIIAGFERPDGGTVHLGDQLIEGPGEHLPPEKRRIGLVFQELALFPHLDVLHNICFGLKKLPRRQRRPRALEVLEMVDLADFASRHVHELSGGQQQRVALARSLAPSPQIILLDEPFANLDPALREETRHKVRRVLKENGTSALLVTHDQEEALSFADRIGVMRRGHVCQIGTPQQIYNRPSCPFVAGFLGRTNLIQTTATGEHAGTPFGQICLDHPTTGPVTVSVRPEHLRLEPPRADQPRGRVISREFKGHDLTYRVHCEGQDLIVQTDYGCRFEVGEEVGISHCAPAVVVEPAGPQQLVELRTAPAVRDCGCVDPPDA